MTVYLDVLIVMNVYISYFALRASARLLHTEIKWSRLAGAAVFGGACSLAALIDAGAAVSVLLRLALTAVTVFIAFGFGKIRLLAVRSFVCFAVSMLICGAAVMIHELSGSDMVFSANGYVYVNISAFVLVAASAVIYGVLSLLRRLFDGAVTDGKVKLSVTDAGSTVVLAALPDSGNSLRDFLTGRPVIVCRKEALGDVVPKNVSAYLAGNSDDITGIRLIPAETVAGSSVLPAFRPDCITAEINGESKRLDALIAVTEAALKDESFDAVISPKLLK